ncbi:MAG: hypothetical protein AB1465_04855 [Patescibacteria group bacterium]
MKRNYMKKIICVIGHSGAGKDSVIKGITGFKRVPRMTTRKPRPGEIEGVHYRFVSPEYLESLAEKGELVYVHRHAGHLYGIEKRKIKELLSSEGNFLIVTTTQEALEIARMAPDQVKIIYIKAPSVNVIEERLRKRGDPEIEIEKQIKSIENNLATIEALPKEDKKRLNS